MAKGTLRKMAAGQKSGTPDWVGRLLNWKFTDALKQLPVLDALREKRGYEVLEALSRTFGNMGWGDIDSDMAKIIDTAVGFVLAEAGLNTDQILEAQGE